MQLSSHGSSWQPGEETTVDTHNELDVGHRIADLHSNLQAAERAVRIFDADAAKGSGRAVRDEACVAAVLDATLMHALFGVGIHSSR